VEVSLHAFGNDIGGSDGVAVMLLAGIQASNSTECHEGWLSTGGSTVAGALIIGAGPGLGTSLARRLAREGMPVGVIARSETTIESLLEALGEVDALGVTADVTDEAGLRAAIDETVDRFGVPELLVYNAALIRGDRLGELSARQQLNAWAVNVVGAITAVVHLAEPMTKAGGGTILITGGLPKPSPEMVSLSLGKAGLRALTELLDDAHSSLGLRVVTVTACGAAASGSALDPDDIAEHYWRLHAAPSGTRIRELVIPGDSSLPTISPPASARDSSDPPTGQPATIRVLLVSGSRRHGSTNTAVLRTVARLAPAGTETPLLDGAWELPIFTPDADAEDRPVDARVAVLRAAVSHADAILISTPEYAGALPAGLKNVLEWTIGDAGTYGKPVAWINAAGPAAPTGAAAAHESLAKVLTYAGAEIVQDACVRVPITRDQVAADGFIHDETVRAMLRCGLETLLAHVTSGADPRVRGDT
jgi:NAD(P)H-dependent FMN reductase/NADP-dependent 3-hydroxy acid dehydrogenase YdfG